MTLFRYQVCLAGQRPSNWGHHLYHSKVEGDLSHDRHTYTDIDTSPRAYNLTSLSEKTQKSYHLQKLENKQHLLLNFLRP